MDRRRFLEWSSAAAVAALSGCTGGSSGGSSSSTSAAPSPVPTPTPTPLPTGPIESEWQGLANSLSGKLIRPGTPDYETARLVVNRRFDSVMPQAVVRCANPADVSNVLSFVQQKGLAVTPRCGGHSYSGTSTTTGVVIDVGPMNTISVSSDGTATIGAGAKLADVYDQLFAKNVAIPSGTCLSVGIAGITLGGGIGLVDRQYGLTCDNLVAAQVVTADGKVLTCNANSEPDLFWALRGGGGGNFGVVTSFTFKTHPTRDLTNFYASFPYDSLPKVLAAWQAWAQDLPKSIWSYLVITFYNPSAAPNVVLSGVCVGTEAEFAPHWSKLLAAIQTTPSTQSVYLQSYRDTMLAFCAGLTISQCHMEGQTPDARLRRYAFAATSDFFNQTIPAEGVTALMKGVADAQAARITGQVIMGTLGGAIGEIALDATAFPHRKARISAEYYMDAPDAATPTWANSMRSVMKPWSSGGAYVNYLDPLIQDWQSAYYGSNYARLVQVKAKYDPNGVFKMAQGVAGK